MSDDPPLVLDRRTLMVGAGLAAAAPPAGATAPAGAQNAASPPPPWTSQAFVERACGRIHVVSVGEGEPVVLLHKLGGWVADWRAVAPLLDAKRRIIAVDLPGHGDSTMLGPPPYLQTVAESASTIMAALDAMGVERFAVAGSSLGGCIGIMMAAFWPDAVTKLSLISVSLNAGVTMAELAKADAETQRGNFTADWAPLPRTLAQVARFGSIDARVNDEDNQSRAKAGVWVRPSERGVGRAGVARYLPRIQSPTLLIYGDRGLYTRYESVGRAGLKTVEVVHIPQCGSFTYQEKPAQTAHTLNAFLDA